MNQSKSYKLFGFFGKIKAIEFRNKYKANFFFFRLICLSQLSVFSILDTVIKITDNT